MRNRRLIDSKIGILASFGMLPIGLKKDVETGANLEKGLHEDINNPKGKDAGGSEHWVTVHGKHIKIGEGGEIKAGNVGQNKKGKENSEFKSYPYEHKVRGGGLTKNYEHVGPDKEGNPIFKREEDGKIIDKKSLSEDARNTDLYNNLSERHNKKSKGVESKTEVDTKDEVSDKEVEWSKKVWNVKKNPLLPKQREILAKIPPEAILNRLEETGLGKHYNGKSEGTPHSNVSFAREMKEILPFKAGTSGGDGSNYSGIYDVVKTHYEDYKRNKLSKEGFLGFLKKHIIEAYSQEGTSGDTNEKKADFTVKKK